MDGQLNKLKENLLYIKGAIRTTPGRPAYMDPDSGAGIALADILNSRRHILERCLQHKKASQGLGRVRNLKGEIVNAAFLYATQPPLVKDQENSTRRDRLWVQFLTDWLEEPERTLESFDKRFTTWANIFVTEYLKLYRRQKTEEPVIEWTQIEQAIPLLSKEDQANTSFFNAIATAPPKEPDEEGEGADSSQERLSMIPLIHELLLNALNAMCKTKTHRADEKLRRVAAVYVLRKYHLLSCIEGFHDIHDLLLERLSGWSDQDTNALREEIEEAAQSLVARTDLARRRVRRDLPQLDYSFILPLLGESLSAKDNYYTAVNRFNEKLIAEVNKHSHPPVKPKGILRIHEEQPPEH